MAFVMKIRHPASQSALTKGSIILKLEQMFCLIRYIKESKQPFNFPIITGKMGMRFGIRLMEQETTPWWKSKAYPPCPRNSGKRPEK